MQLSWIKCGTADWCPFETVNLAGLNAYGVYVIWHAGVQPWTVRVGQGSIAERLIAHRADALITAHRGHGLYVTWASVPAAHVNGVENYLANQLQPKVGERFPNVVPISVNLPW
jgi:hypothetical protein